MEIKALQQKQQAYDENYWQHHEQDENIRHNTLHIMKLAAKLSTYCELREHGKTASSEQIEKEVIPDLLSYALRLANLFDKDLEASYEQRLQDNIQRLYTKP